MKSSQTQTEMFCSTCTQTDIPHSRDAWTDKHDILSDVETQTNVIDKNLMSTNEKTDKLRHAEVQTTPTLKTEDKIIQTCNVNLEDCLIESNNEENESLMGKHILKTDTKVAVDCETQTESGKSVYVGDSKESLSDGVSVDKRKPFEQYETTTNVSLNTLNNSCGLKQFSKSLDCLQKYGLISMSNTGSQTDFPFQATFRPVRLFGTLLPTFNLSPMATLLTPLGNFDFCITVVISFQQTFDFRLRFYARKHQELKMIMSLWLYSSRKWLPRPEVCASFVKKNTKFNLTFPL